MMPRIQGKVGQVEDAKDKTLIGKWTYTIYVSVIGLDKKIEFNFDNFYTSEKEAAAALREECQKIASIITEEVFGEKTSRYLDLKSGQVRPWMEN